MRSLAHGSGFTHSRMGDEENEHVWKHRAHACLQPNLLLQRRSDGGDGGPSPEDFR